MQPRHSNRELYFREQVVTTRDYVIPFVEQLIPVTENTRVLEVGCGEGGNLVPFLDRGCHATGIDLSESKIEHARQFLQDHPNYGRLTLLADDIYNLDEVKTGSFDLIILRDVIEHIHDQEKFMHFIRKFLKQEGAIYFGFPPWYNPFGGHQQICSNRILSKLPYFHLLPEGLYRFILNTGGETPEKIDALLEIKETGISIERFERILKKTNYSIRMKRLYLINPNYEIKFKLRPVKQWKIISAIPVFRNFISTAAYYVVTTKH